MVLSCMEMAISQVLTPTPTPTFTPPTTEAPTTIEPSTVLHTTEPSASPVPPTTEPSASPVPQSPTEPSALSFRGRLIQSENTQRQNAAPQTDQLGFHTYAQGNSMWNLYGYAYPQWGSRAYAQDNQRWNPWQYVPYNQWGPRAYSQSYPRWNPYIQWRDYARQNLRARIQNMYGFNK